MIQFVMLKVAPANSVEAAFWNACDKAAKKASASSLSKVKGQIDPIGKKAANNAFVRALQ